MDDLNKRVLSIMERKQMTRSGFATALDISLPVLTHISSGRNKPGLDLITKILSRFPEISPDWLLLGEGEMHRQVDQLVDFKAEIDLLEGLKKELQAQEQHLLQVLQYHQLLLKEISYLGDLDALLQRNRQGANYLGAKLDELKLMLNEKEK